LEDPAAIHLESNTVFEKVRPVTGQSAVSFLLTQTVKSSSVAVEQGTIGSGHIHSPVELLTLVMSINGFPPNFPQMNLPKVLT
jgi:hypothetical protein